METCRNHFYLAAKVVVFTFAITNIFQSMNVDVSQTQMHIVRPTGLDNNYSPGGVVSVVAPWTYVPRIEGRSISESTRSFVFADIAKVERENYAMNMAPLDQELKNMINNQLISRLCIGNDKQNCERNVEIFQCLSCTEEDGAWYSAVSQTAAVFGRVDASGDVLKRSDNYHHSINNGKNISETLKLHFPNYNDGPFMYDKLEIAVPLAEQDDKLLKFAAGLRASIQEFQSGLNGLRIAIRLLVTRFSFDNPSPKDADQLEEFRRKLTKAAGLQGIGDEVVFVPVNSTNNQFSRSKAINALHQSAHHDDRSVLAVLDVDMSVGSKFLRNALTFPFPQAAAFFPVVWSEFNPESVKLIEQFHPGSTRLPFSNHRGQWRQFGFGIYAITGSDACRLSLDESFVGWGGEDVDFFATVRKQLNVIRLRETGLTHVWHEKRCESGGFVEEKFMRACIGSMSHFEGSPLGMHLMRLKEQNGTQLDELLKTVTQKRR
ncbi:chondroitin N-acetylgalactosaminyltransferase [Nitzschia inconspicua]|uniref:Chondroitin N-acetylgalactosaminyltransferase n=1 Tax=Nitzschia inconspicua TaxID=303405 RepID=A0A9K3PHR6_9STRA|nr:chondroitin N-acetylgalactosaminyltransferase [Nitzschia inconspicua]